VFRRRRAACRSICITGTALTSETGTEIWLQPNWQQNAFFRDMTSHCRADSIGTVWRHIAGQIVSVQYDVTLHAKWWRYSMTPHCRQDSDYSMTSHCRADSDGTVRRHTAGHIVVVQYDVTSQKTATCGHRCDGVQR